MLLWHKWMCVSRHVLHTCSMKHAACLVPVCLQDATIFLRAHDKTDSQVGVPPPTQPRPSSQLGGDASSAYTTLPQQPPIAFCHTPAATALLAPFCPPVAACSR